MYQVEAVGTFLIVFISIAALIGLMGLIYKLLPEHRKEQLDKIGEPNYIEVEEEK